MQSDALVNVIIPCGYDGSTCIGILSSAMTLCSAPQLHGFHWQIAAQKNSEVNFKSISDKCDKLSCKTCWCPRDVLQSPHPSIHLLSALVISLNQGIRGRIQKRRELPPLHLKGVGLSHPSPLLLSFHQCNPLPLTWMALPWRPQLPALQDACAPLHRITPQVSPPI